MARDEGSVGAALRGVRLRAVISGGGVGALPAYDGGNPAGIASLVRDACHLYGGILIQQGRVGIVIDGFQQPVVYGDGLQQDLL